MLAGCTEDCKLVRLRNATATDKLNKQCSRAECNVIVITFFENFGRCTCVCVTITLHSTNYNCYLAYQLYLQSSVCTSHVKKGIDIIDLLFLSTGICH